MLRGHDIVCFANDWDSDPLSKKHVMVRLARDNRVLWVNSLGCRNPTASARDLRRVAKKLADFLRGRRQVAENLWVTSPLVVPFHGSAAARRFNRWWLAASLRWTCRRLGMKRPITWSFLPSSGDVVGRLGERLVVYQCVDEYSEFTGADAAAISALEARLAARADVVLVSAGPLYESKRRLNRETHLVTHGVELEHFRRALDPATEPPADLGRPAGGAARDPERPVIGFFGLIADWVDLDLVAHLARSRPRWELVLIGQADTDVSGLASLPNVRLLGRRSYDDLPAYCKGFDVAILPFKINELTLAANPLKLREYLAAGLPVVATAIPEAERLAPLVRVGRDREHFLAQLDELVESGATGPREAISRAMDAESWDHKVAEMTAIVGACLEPRDATAARLCLSADAERGASLRAERTVSNRTATAAAVGATPPAARTVSIRTGTSAAGGAAPGSGSTALSRSCRSGGWVLPVLLAALTAAACARAPAAERDDLVWWTTHALEKVRLADPPGAGPWRDGPVELQAARNEFEPFQLVLRAEGRALRGIDAEITDLVPEASGEGIASRHATVYLERTLDLERPSSIEGAAGEWPDPLVPRVDPYAGERRNAFPFDLEPGRNQALWIELYVPPETAPGTYRGEVRVSVAGEPRLAVALELEVWPFALPSTASFATSYGFSGPLVLREHRGGYTSDDELYELTRRYAEAALRHRLSLHGGSMVPPPTTFREGEAVLDWSRFDREAAPLLDGTVFGDGDPLPGARVTSIDVTTPAELSDERRVLYWRAWAEHFRERGWLDRLFVYLWDEPSGPDDYPRVRHLGNLARRADPELPVLLTEQLVSALAEVVDVWVPLVNCFEERRGVGSYCEETVPRSAYRPAERAGARVWWYQSCVSHGCGSVGGRDFTGWPSYVIDAPAVAHRIMPWLAWSFGIEGELYFNTVEVFGREGGDPWRDVHDHGGNGDGTLFYPGTPERIGGATHIPIESLRLKLIREGLEDYEYLALLARAGEAGAARAQTAAIARGTFRWEHSPEALYAARRALGTRLAELAATGHRPRQREAS
ncbi:MAG TPA: glycoside hydrolase domain-containing protein [Thermoanaerobaculia bacterium]|nr:glycoside hydrolase domain-containing protein [Thermoanaerobaculia bacterium]